MKCTDEHCPLWVDEADIPAYKSCRGGCSYFHRDPCHLTPSDMEAILQAIAGEGRLVSWDGKENLMLVAKIEKGKPVAVIPDWLEPCKQFGEYKITQPLETTETGQDQGDE